MRKIERHPSNQGSVITFDMYGKEVQLFVADAKYRTVKAWAAGNTYGTDIPSLYNFTDDIRHINSNIIGDKDTQPLSYTMSDAQLQSRFPSFKADKTAKENTDILMCYSDTEAAHWCRSIELEGAGALDLPNIYELMILYLESDRLDELDPTANAYKQFALGILNSCGRFNFNNFNACWASTECTGGSARYVTHVGYVTDSGKDISRGIIPVKEL